MLLLYRETHAHTRTHISRAFIFLFTRWFPLVVFYFFSSFSFLELRNCKRFMRKTHKARACVSLSVSLGVLFLSLSISDSCVSVCLWESCLCVSLTLTVFCMSVCIWQFFERLCLSEESVSLGRLFVYVSITLSLSLAVCLGVCVFVWLSVFLSLLVSVWLVVPCSVSGSESPLVSVSLWLCLSVCLSECDWLSVCVSLSIYMRLCLWPLDAAYMFLHSSPSLSFPLSHSFSFQRW